MRAIAKQGSGGNGLSREHSSPPATSGLASRRWRRFGDKQIVLQALLDEQYQLCCYSELRADKDELGYHIEHVENKRQAPARTFDYGNLAASALRSDLLHKLSPDEAFGGHAKEKQRSCDVSRLVSCHQIGCARYFAYLSDGRVTPSLDLDVNDHAKARYTIDLLNLNSPFLIMRRRQWWGELDDCFQDHLERGWSLSHLASVDLVPAGGGLSQFFSLTRQFFGRVAEQTLRQLAPELV